jgi:hypothetical protein
MYTKGQWIPDISRHKQEPKEIYRGIMVEKQPSYHVRLFDTVLPETDEEYEKERKEIEANVKLACDAPNLLCDLQKIAESPFPANETEMRSWCDTARKIANDAIKKHSHQ